MATLKVKDFSGGAAGTVKAADAVFGIEPNTFVLHQVVRSQLAGARSGTHSTKTRGMVRGGGKKPWRQKGTGRARAGSTRAPNWTHGGVAFPPKPRDYSYTLNKKVKRLALKSALSVKAAEGGILVIEDLKLDEIKTKVFQGFLDKLEAPRALVITKEADQTVIRSARNLPGVTTTIATVLSPYAVLGAPKLVVDKAALQTIEEVYA